MSTTFANSNDNTINTSAITGSKAGGASLYPNKEGYERQGSFSKDSGSGWGSLSSPRKGEGFQWSQTHQQKSEQGLIGKLLDTNAGQIERNRYHGLVGLSPSSGGARAQTFQSQSAAMQSSQSAVTQSQQQPALLNQPQQFAQPQQFQQQQQQQQQQQLQFQQPQQLQQSAPLLQKQQSVAQSTTFVNQQSSLPLSQTSSLQQRQQWTQPTKTLWASETGPVTIQQPPVCLPMEALVIKPEPIMVPQPPVVFQPEAIQVAQPPIVFRPEPITVPLPPLTIQPEPVMVQRPPLMVQPPPIVLRRPDVQMNPVFSLALKYGCSTTADVACSTDQCVPINSLTPAQQASFSQFSGSGASSLSQPARTTGSQSFTMH